MSAPLSKSEPPYIVKPLPDEHYVVGDDWQLSYYDVTSGADLGPYVKLPGGPVNPATGQLTGEPFSSSGPWKQT